MPHTQKLKFHKSYITEIILRTSTTNIHSEFVICGSYTWITLKLTISKAATQGVLWNAARCFRRIPGRPSSTVTSSSFVCHWYTDGWRSVISKRRGEIPGTMKYEEDPGCQGGQLCAHHAFQYKERWELYICDMIQIGIITGRHHIAYPQQFHYEIYRLGSW